MKMQYKLLVAEDDIGNFLLFKRHMARWGFTIPVYHFVNGKCLVDFLRKDIPDNDNRMILLDLDMPVMNGFEVLRKIRSDPFISRTKVYIRTTDKSQNTINHCYELGCNGYFVKPMTRQEIEFVLSRNTDKFITSNLSADHENKYAHAQT